MFFHASVANTISAIKVGYIAKHVNVRIPLVKKNEIVLNKLVDVGAIASYAVENTQRGRLAQITLAYVNGRPAINSISYIGHHRVKASVRLSSMVMYRKTNWSINILSTSKGLLTVEEAITEGVGGFPLISVTF